MALKKQKAAEIIDIGPTVSEDEQLATTDGLAIRDWVAGIAAFFTTAAGIEKAAVATLAQAKALVLPTSMIEDERVQRFILKTTQDRKGAEAHWEIAQIVHRFHRRLTAKRTLATGPLEQANALATGLHNRYVNDEKRRAALEQERVRQEAEQKAREDRDRELARLEAEALKREESSTDLSEREQAFVSDYLVSHNGQMAAHRAGYKDPLRAAGRLLAAEKIQAALRAGEEAKTIRAQVAARREMPLEVEVAEVRAEVSNTITHDRTTWTGEVLDEAALVEAVISGRFGIPRDVLTVNGVKLNEYARSLRERLDLWPGCRAKKTTRAV